MTKSFEALKKFLSSKGFYPGYDEDYKAQAKGLGQKFLKDVAHALGLDEFKVDYNKAGIACSGDHNLIGLKNGKGIYISFNLDGVISGGDIRHKFIMYRAARHMKDWSGCSNNWTELFVDEEILLKRFNSLLQ